MPSDTSPFKVKRTPVLTLWATAVAEWLGYQPESVLTPDQFAAVANATAQARRFPIATEIKETKERYEPGKEFDIHIE